MDGVMAIGSFTFVADPNDPTRCSEECPQHRRGTKHSRCVWFGMLPCGIYRTVECLAAEKHEAERPARWLRLDSSELWAGAIACNNCGFMDAAAELSDCHATCPGCGKRMV